MKANRVMNQYITNITIEFEGNSIRKMSKMTGILLSILEKH